MMTLKLCEDDQSSYKRRYEHYYSSFDIGGPYTSQRVEENILHHACLSGTGEGMETGDGGKRESEIPQS